MRDAELREATHQKLLRSHRKDPNALIIDELGLWHGAARIDIAVVNGYIHGYEIKSERDNLDRLPRQAEVYCEILDRITVVASYNHVEPVLKMVPRWWGVKCALVGPRGGISFTTVRASGQNPAVNPATLASLLWREEALCILEGLGCAQGLKSKPRAQVHAALADCLELKDLKREIRAALKERRDWRVGQQ